MGEAGKDNKGGKPEASASCRALLVHGFFLLQNCRNNKGVGKQIREVNYLKHGDIYHFLYSHISA